MSGSLNPVPKALFVAYNRPSVVLTVAERFATVLC